MVYNRAHFPCASPPQTVVITKLTTSPP
jgi:hypothetical protein